MRWHRLFTDLEAQAEAAERWDFAQEVAERSRYDIGKLRLVDRLRAAAGHSVVIWCNGGVNVEGQLDHVGSDWLEIIDHPGRRTVIPLRAIAGVSGLGALSAQPFSEGEVERRLAFRQYVRGVVRDRATIEVLLTNGLTLWGTGDRVGEDFVEVAEHYVDEARRSAAVRGVRTIPLRSIVFLRVHERGAFTTPS